jgi:hypothetical protein
MIHLYFVIEKDLYLRINVSLIMNIHIIFKGRRSNLLVAHKTSIMWGLYNFRKQQMDNSLN